jgi:hypothetical protein
MSTRSNRLHLASSKKLTRTSTSLSGLKSSLKADPNSESSLTFQCLQNEWILSFGISISLSTMAHIVAYYVKYPLMSMSSFFFTALQGDTAPFIPVVFTCFLGDVFIPPVSRVCFLSWSGFSFPVLPHTALVRFSCVPLAGDKEIGLRGLNSPHQDAGNAVFPYRPYLPSFPTLRALAGAAVVL